MNKNFTNDELDHLLSFIGYGRLDADIWFLGYEEIGGTPEILPSRLHFQQVEDSATAQNITNITLQQFGDDNLQGAWRGISIIMLKLEGKPTTEENIRKYQENYLGRDKSSALICTLLPIPRSMNQWNYEAIIPQYPTADDYYNSIKKLRFPFIRELINQNLPKIIVCNGKSAWNDFQELFSDFSLTLQDSFMLGWNANTVIILCEDISSSTMQYDQLVGIILENSLSIDVAKPTGPIPISKAELARQKKDAARKASAAKRKPSAKHNPADPFCVCAYCLGYEND